MSKKMELISSKMIHFVKIEHFSTPLSVISLIFGAHRLIQEGEIHGLFV